MSTKPYELELNGSAYTPSVRHYAVTTRALELLMAEVLKDDFIKNLSSGFTQPLNFIQSIKVVPYNAMGIYSTTTGFILGNSVVTITNSGYANSGRCETKLITKKFSMLGNLSASTFTDFEPYTKAQLYLPYVGFTDIAIKDIAGQKPITITLIIEPASGNATYTLSRQEKDKKGNSQEVVLYTWNCSMAVDIAIGGTNTQLQQQAMFRTGTTAIAGATTLGLGLGGLGSKLVMSGVSSLGSAVESLPSTQTEQLISRGTMGQYNTSFNNPHSIYFIIEKKTINDYDSFKSYYGKPLNQKKTLSSLKGITFIPNPKLEINNITKEEFDLLNQKLVDGVIL